jgi:phosphoenolpyruvate-protein phosphotransferase
MSPSSDSPVADYTFRCPLFNGLHARPANHLQELAGRFESKIVLINERSGRQANAKSVLSLMGAGFQHGDPCRLQVEGVDAGLAREEIRRFLETDFAGCDAPLPVLPAAASAVLPRCLQSTAPSGYRAGTVLSPGIGRGELVLFFPSSSQRAARKQPHGTPAEEERRLDGMLAQAKDGLRQEIARADWPEIREVLKAHEAIVNDSAFLERVRETLRGSSLPAEEAVEAAVKHFAEIFRNSGQPYLMERALDMEDVRRRLVEAGGGAEEKVPALQKPSLVAADRLSPGQFLALDRRWLRGLVMADAGTTSHTVLLARSLGVPALGGMADAAEWPEGMEMLLDAEAGLVFLQMTPEIDRYYRREEEVHGQLRSKDSGAAAGAAITRDGVRLEIGVNVASGEEVEAAVEAGAEGVGLFRTEMIFLEAARAPGEETQYQSYAAAIRAARGRPVILRLLDVGGDKPAAYLDLPQEANPFLGRRGIRLYGPLEEILRTQVKAVVRAAKLGPVKMMVPMVSSAEEMRRFKEWVSGEVAASPFPVEIGAMVEVPSAAFQMAELARHADFFSIGTNDLSQYFFAADRENPAVAGLCDPLHPAFLRLLDQVAREVRQAGRWVGLCGQMAEKEEAIPLLIGLGLDEISMPAPKIAAAKRAVCRVEAAACRDLWKKTLSCSLPSEVKELLETFWANQEAGPMLSPDLVRMEVDVRNKAEAVREIIHTLRLAGRTAAPGPLEEEIWQREAAYSTGIGDAVAIPHVKSRHLRANSIVILKLRQAVDWGSVDGNPVSTVIFLGAREPAEGREHLRLLAQLSRQLMREEFRAGLRAENDSAALVDFLVQALNLGALSPSK